MFPTSYFAIEYFAPRYFERPNAIVPVHHRDTHDGGADERKRFKRTKERLREQLEQALEGPRAEEVKQALTPYVEPQKTDSVYRAYLDRILIDQISAEVQQLIEAANDEEMAIIISLL